MATAEELLGPVTGELVTFQSHTLFKKRQFHPGPAASQTQLHQAWLAAGDTTRAEIAKHAFSSPSEFNSSSWLFLPANAPHTGYGVGDGHFTGMGINFSPKRTFNQPTFQGHGSPLSPPGSPPPSLQTSLFSLPSHLLESLVFLTLDLLP